MEGGVAGAAARVLGGDVKEVCALVVGSCRQLRDTLRRARCWRGCTRASQVYDSVVCEFEEPLAWGAVQHGRRGRDCGVHEPASVGGDLWRRP